ncbi:calcium-activated potassium channel subunit alpha-1-like [Pelodytes ibericus]
MAASEPGQKANGMLFRNTFIKDLGGIAIILLWRALQFVRRAHMSNTVHCVETSGWFLKKNKKKIMSLHIQVIYLVERLLSAQTLIGKVLVMLVFLFSIGTVILYFIMSTHPIEICHYSGEVIAALDLFFHSFFIFYFGLRFIAAKDKLAFWMELDSIVDFFTIPPICVSLYLGGNWLGLRFLRALRLLELPKILLLLKVTKTSTAIKLSNLLATFLSCWLTAAGFLHLMEITGDPWLGYENAQKLSYFDCIYMVMVTMSTVGYGDITAQTTLGRIFMIFFFVGGLAMFASKAPEIMAIVGKNKQNKGSHMIMGGRKHIVVCGYITLENVTALLNEFLDRDKGDISTEILFMEEITLNLELEAMFKCHHIQTTFFYGSVLNYNDLNRVKMQRADACLILANKHASDPRHEDMKNIMRTISIKRYYPQTRVIIQILKSENKIHLQNIPAWDWRLGDAINCLQELKLGFMAQSCLVPGLSTMLINLCAKKDHTEVNKNSWQWHFLDSANNSLLTGPLSNDFVGMTFNEVCRFIILHFSSSGAVRFEYKNGVQDAECGVYWIDQMQENRQEDNCSQQQTSIRGQEISGVVMRSSVYCRLCHDGVHNPLLIKKCTCVKPLPSSSGHDLLMPKMSRSLGVLPDPDPRQPIRRVHSKTMLDSTGMFHWCKEVPLEKAALTHREAALMNFQDHIVVSIFGESNSTLIGLRDFVMPLRTSNLAYEELKPIIFLGELSYMKREWTSIQYFPKLFLFPGSGLSCANLRSVNISKCSMCVIMSSVWTGETKQYMEDTECILATLNMRSMNLRHRPSSSASMNMPGQKEPLSSIPVITELKKASNITFISEDNKIPKHAETDPHLTSTFATGSVFSEYFLDALMPLTYFNWQVLGLLQTLVTGGSTPELEEQLADEDTLIKSSPHAAHDALRDRCKLCLIPLTDPRFQFSEGDTYGNIFCKELESSNVICIGIYRLMDATSPIQSRYVITRPVKHFLLLPTDLLYCVAPFQEHPSVSAFGGQELKTIKPVLQDEVLLNSEKLSKIV